jgi:hypothetical protein
MMIALLRGMNARPTECQIKEANRLGLRHRETGDYVCWWNRILGTAYYLGWDGIDLSDAEVVGAHRWGHPHEDGISVNHAEDRAERGCSCAWLDSNPSDCYGYMSHASGSDCVAIRGVLVPDTGSDGEPLVLLVGDGVEFD